MTDGTGQATDQETGGNFVDPEVFRFERRGMRTLTGRVGNAAVWQMVERLWPALAREIARLVGTTQADQRGAVTLLDGVLGAGGFSALGSSKDKLNGEKLWGALAFAPLTVSLGEGRLLLECGELVAWTRQQENLGSTGDATPETGCRANATIPEALERRDRVEASERSGDEVRLAARRRLVMKIAQVGKQLERLELRIGRLEGLVERLVSRLEQTEAARLALRRAGQAGDVDVGKLDLGDWEARVAAFVEALEAVIKSLPAGSAKTTWEAEVQRVQPALEDVRMAGLALTRAQDAATQLPIDGLRQMTVALADVLYENAGEASEPTAAALRRAELAADVEAIVPSPGDKADPILHEWDPQPVVSPHARGCVARVVRRGYRAQGNLVRKARVVISAGPVRN